MPVTGSVELIGRQFTAQSIRRQYHFHGVATEAEALAHIAALPQSIGGLPLSQVDGEEVGDIAGDWNVDLFYGALPPGKPLNPQTIGTVEYGFNFQAPGGRIKRSLETISWSTVLGTVTSSANTASVNAANFDGLIGVVETADGQDVEGIDISPPPETFSLRYSAPTGIINTNYQLLVESMVGKVNSATFGGRPAGSLFLTRVNGGVTTRVSTMQSQNNWNIDFGFAYSPNAFNLQVGLITVPLKLGWHLLWTYHRPVDDAGGKAVVPRPQTALVERIFDTADFRLLGLPGYTT